MFITHKLKPGESFASVMKKYGVKDWKTTWDLPQNKRLKARRRYADKVEAGDVLTVLDPKVKFHPVTLLGKTYNIPAPEWDGVKAAMTKEIKKKFLPKLKNLKKAYDDDYQFMWEIANGNGALTGMLVAVVENVTRAKMPTREMNAVYAAINRVEKCINAGDFAGQCAAMGEADKAMKDYVKAAETYRRKMTSGSSAGVELLELTRDGCFIVATALATGGASAVVGTAFTAVEIGAAMGAAGAFVKAASGEIGNKLANEPRTGKQIAFNMITKTLEGAATGALGGLIVGRFAKYAGGAIARDAMKQCPKIVRHLVASEATSLLGLGSATVSRIGVSGIADIVGKTILRVTVSTWIKVAVDLMKENLPKVAAAGKAVFGAASGRESEKTVGGRIGSALLSDGFAEMVVRRICKDHKSAIQKAVAEADTQAA